jgi:hypothetical protein
MSIPKTFRAGTTSDNWSVNLTDYPTGDGWTVSMLLNSGAQQYTVNATADGSEWAFSVDVATSTGWVSGDYAYVIQASKGGAVYQPKTGTITITAAFGSTPAKLTQLETDLASVDAAIRQVISSGGIKAHRLSIPSVSDREYEWIELPQLRMHRMWILGEIERVKKDLGLQSKKSGYRKIKSVLS